MTTTAPPRGRTTVELVALMCRFTKMTQTEARRILRELERDGWATSDGDEWRATQRARDHCAALEWEVGEEAHGGKAAFGWARKIA